MASTERGPACMKVAPFSTTGAQLYGLQTSSLAMANAGAETATPTSASGSGTGPTGQAVYTNRADKGAIAIYQLSAISTPPGVQASNTNILSASEVSVITSDQGNGVQSTGQVLTNPLQVSHGHDSRIDKGIVCLGLPCQTSANGPPGQQSLGVGMHPAQERQTSDGNQGYSKGVVGQATAPAATLPRSNDARADRGAVFIIEGLDQAGQAIIAGKVKQYMMVGKGASGNPRRWRVSGTPDFSASRYLGGDTPLTNVYIYATWV